MVGWHHNWRDMSWANSRKWWRTGKPVVLQPMESQCLMRLSNWTTTVASPKKPLKTDLPPDPAVLLWIYLDKMKTLIQKESCTLAFKAALFMIAKTQKQPKCPLTYEWIKKMWDTHTYIHRHTNNEIYEREVSFQMLNQKDKCCNIRRFHLLYLARKKCLFLSVLVCPEYKVIRIYRIHIGYIGYKMSTILHFEFQNPRHPFYWIQPTHLFILLS